MPEKMLAICFSILILGQAWVVRLWIGTWIFPACLFGVFWFAYTFLPLVALPTVPVDPYAIAFILICCSAFSFTALSFDWSRVFALRQRTRVADAYDTPFIRINFWVLTALTIVCFFVNVAIQGFSVADLTLNLMATASEYISLRYADALVPNIFGQLSVVLGYPAAILGGMVYATRPQSSNGNCVLIATLVPSVLTMVVQGAKGTLFLVLVLMWAGVLLVKISRNDFSLIRRRSLLMMSAYALVLLPAVIASFLARGLSTEAGLEVVYGALIRYFASYSCAHLYSFSDWFHSVTQQPSEILYLDDFYTYGFYTFMAVFRLFGDERVIPAGVYDEYFTYQDLIQSNIYTMFRGLIVDFGFVGCVVFMAAFGLLMHWAYRALLLNRLPALTASLFAHSLGYYYSSFIISLLIWNSIYASCILLALILWANKFFSRAAYPTSEKVSEMMSVSSKQQSPEKI